jgi:hypothetical protein
MSLQKSLGRLNTRRNSRFRKFQIGFLIKGTARIRENFSSLIDGDSFEATTRRQKYGD